MSQSIVALDLEGVLIPEIWVAVAEGTGIPELRRTTREEPDYAALMRRRLALLDRHAVGLSAIQGVIGTLSCLDGARSFVEDLRAFTQVLIVSDTFEQFAAPLLRALQWPTLLCHRLVVADDRIVDYQLRVPEQKQKTVAALQRLNYRVIAVGDSFNDVAMLAEADVGLLFRAPPLIARRYPRFTAVDTYPDLTRLIERAVTAHAATPPARAGRFPRRRPRGL